MEKYDVRLHELQSLIDGKLHAEAVLKDLCDQKRILEKKVWELNHARMSEQSDVDRLEGTSLRSVILGVLGKKRSGWRKSAPSSQPPSSSATLLRRSWMLSKS